MPSTSWLIKQLTKDYPKLRFVPGEVSYWSPSSQIVYYQLNSKNASWVLLHETAHALLNHHDYKKDVELLAKERDAWELARKELAPKYGISIGEDFIENHLDTYRDWLHNKSTCPNCHLNGVEKSKGSYLCLACGSQWRVNDARTCHIKRTKIK